MGEIRDNLKDNLRYYLGQSNTTQKELALQLGVSQSAVTNWIKGKNSPDIELVASICNILNVSLLQLMTHRNSTDSATDMLNVNKGIEVPVNTAAVHLSADALRVAHAYDSASNGIRASVEKLLDIDKIDDPIEAELASYRLELEAEQEAKRLSASDTCGTNSETRKMA